MWDGGSFRVPVLPFPRVLVLVCHSLASCAVHFSAAVLLGVAGFVFLASPRAQIWGLCQQTRVLPQRDELVPAKEKARNVAPPFPP